MIPLFDYGSVVWSKCNKTNAIKISKLQKSTARRILNKPLGTPSLELFRELTWLSFTDRCSFQTAVLVYKGLHNLAPMYISNLITITENKNYNLRSSSNMDIIHLKPKTDYLKQSFSYSGMQIWNNIPVHIRLCSTLNSFKSNFRAHLIKRNP